MSWPCVGPSPGISQVTLVTLNPTFDLETLGQTEQEARSEDA